MLSHSERKHNTLTCDTCSYLAIWQRRQSSQRPALSQRAWPATPAFLVGSSWLSIAKYLRQKYLPIQNKK